MVAEISRKEARRAGLTRYFTGKACLHGHVAERYVGSGTCLECHYVKIKHWYNRWRLTDVGKATLSGRMKKYRTTERGRQKGREQYLRHVASGARDRYWKTDHFKERTKIGHARRRARQRNARGRFTKADYDRLIQTQKACYLCKGRFTKKRKPTLEHLVALSKGGSNDPSNVALTCEHCNKAKGAKRLFLC